MSTRWWAPVTPGTLAGDELDMLLVGGGDPQADLGLVLVAGHKAGAAALQDVAKSSLASESSLVAALATARTSIAPRMVDAIAGATGGVYAGLLVRDVLDEADQGALDVYRTAVAKGVAPPMALERAAAGYGLPMKAMGQFAALAADPKANPRAVEDAADRCLMTYVAEVAKQESVSEVAKAAPREDRTAVADADFDERLHPRGGDGRFVDAPDVAPPMSALDRVRSRLGLLSTEPTRVAQTTKTPTATPDAVAARQARAKRIAAGKTRRAKAATRAAQTTTQRAPAQRRAAQRAPASRAYLQRLAASFKTNLRPGELKPDSRLPTPDLLKKLPLTGSSYYDIGQPVVIGTSMKAGAVLRGTSSNQAMLQKDPSRRIFRIGYLLKESRYAEQSGQGQVERHESAAEIERNTQPYEYMAPKVEFIYHNELTGNEEADKAYVEKKRKKLVQRRVVDQRGELRTITDYDELGNVVPLPLYIPLGDEQYDDEHRPAPVRPEAKALVHFLPADVSKPEERPMPSVDEYVILHDARGYEENQRYGAQVTLDPNAIYEIVNSPDKDRHALIGADQMWDDKNLVVVNRWYLRPVGEDEVKTIIEGIEKALLPTEVQRFNQLHPRDTEGQFAVTDTAQPDTEQVTQTPTVAPAMAARLARSKRIARNKRKRLTRVTSAQAAPAQRAATLAPAQRRPVERRSAVRHPMIAAIQRKVTERVKAQETPAPILSDTRKYKLLRESFFQNLFPRNETSNEDFARLHRGESMKLTNRQRLLVSHTQDSSLIALDLGIAENVNRAIKDQMIERELLASIPLPIPENGAIPDFDDISEKVDHILRTRPDLDMVELGLDDASKEVMVWGSVVSGAYQNIIEFDPDLKMTGDLYLTFHGEHRAANMLVQGQDATYNLIENLVTMDDEGKLFNPYVHYYRLTSAPVRRFRLDDQ